MWIPQCAQCFLHFWRYNNIPWKPVCHWDFDILMWLLPSWCDFLPTRCYMGLMCLLPNWCDLNPSLVCIIYIYILNHLMFAITSTPIKRPENFSSLPGLSRCSRGPIWCHQVAAEAYVQCDFARHRKAVLWHALAWTGMVKTEDLVNGRGYPLVN